jgi:hypothetical protein
MSTKLLIFIGPQQAFDVAAADHIICSLSGRTITGLGAGIEAVRRYPDFMAAYNFARRLKTLRGLTLYEYIVKTRASGPNRFIANQVHQMPELNT